MTPAQVEEKRASILAAAVRVFGQKGYHATNVADIARSLGAGHGTFYRYYQNKLDIFRHVIDHAVARVAEALAHEGPPTDADDIGEYRRQVEGIAARLNALFLAEDHVARLLFVEAVGIDPEITRRLEVAYEAFAGMTEAYLVNGQRKGFLRPDLDTQTTARAINAMIFESVRQGAQAQDPAQTARAWTRAVVALMFDGMAAR